MKLGVLFSGQGTQFVGMGLDFYQNHLLAKAKLDTYAKDLNLDLISLLNDSEKINDTRYTQPLMVAVEMMIHDILKQEYNLKPHAYVGFSLGEYTAFYTSGFYQEKEILNLISKRAELMQDAAKKHEGGMAAILQLEDQVIEALCQSVSGKEVVVAANYNAPGQLVISGDKELIHQVVELAKEKGARRAVILNVSGAFHSPYMKDAGKALKAYASTLEAKKPHTQLYANSTAKVLDPNLILEEIETQIQKPVYFKQTIENMVKEGYTHFLEIGPGSVLSGLVRKINPELKVANISTFEDYKNIKEFIYELKR
ncbi:MAG TPA: ACP S-malonyltransferase [Acholeplasma sp.]|jgi:[acyl-carrier-protein] S-malonyltransferase